MTQTIQGVMWTIALAIVFVPLKVTFVIPRCQSTRVGQIFIWPELNASLKSCVHQSTKLISCLRVTKLVLVGNFGVEGGSTPGDLESEG